MPLDDTHLDFSEINTGYNSVFTLNKLTVGLVVPIETYTNSATPTMLDHIERVTLAESLGFSAVWLRDVPFNVPSFGDAGQLFDPFVYLGALAASTQTIALGVSSIILPIRHPAHVAKAAASADVLSKGRLILGVASGDRPDEYPALNVSFEDRGLRFRQHYHYIQSMWRSYPQLESASGMLSGNIDMLPKPHAKKFPMLVTGGSQQSAEWIAQHADGWMIYPKSIELQAKVINQWKDNLNAAKRSPQPVMQPLYIDLADDPNSLPQPIHLGFRLGRNHLLSYLKSLEAIGVNHVALNLRFNRADIKNTLTTLSEHILTEFNSN